MRIIALRARGIGDFLTAVPALRALREAHPRASLAVAAPGALAPLAALADCHLYETAPLAPLPARAHGADLLVDLHGRGPQSHRVALGAAPRRLIAFAHDEVPETRGMPEWRDGEHEVARWCRLLAESGIPADPAALHLPAPRLPFRLQHLHGATVVHPGAGSAARRWPAERFADVAAAEHAAGRAVVVTGAQDERRLAEDVARAAGLPRSAVLAGRTDLRALAALVAHAGRVVCGDTGVGHLATAFATPSVVLFGPASPALWGPPPSERHRVLWAGRTGDPHADEPDEGLLEIDSDAVLEALDALEVAEAEPALERRAGAGARA